MAQEERRPDGFTALEERFRGYQVYDRDGSKIGKVDDLFIDESDQPEYIGVKMGLLGTKSTLIPMDLASVDESQGRIEVSADKETIKDGPAFDDDREITPEYENEVRSYYGLGALGEGPDRGHYGDYEGHSGSQTTGSETAGTVGPGMTMGDTETGEFREHDRGDEGVHQSRGDDLEDEDELRVQRSEEELRAGTREREAGSVNVRKRVRTERESVPVSKRREEVHVDRVPVSGEASEAEIGDDEVRVPITEDEVVVEKKPVVKEELRIRKEVVEDEEIVEEDVRKEEVDVDDETTRRDG